MSEEVTIRKFTAADIGDKIRWINDPRNNKHLRFELPLEYEKTMQWFERIKDDKNRFDCVIEVNLQPVGIIGLLNIDEYDKRAEIYFTLGEYEHRGKGVVHRARAKLIEYAFETLGLEKIYSYVHIDNIESQNSLEKSGFVREGLLKRDVLHNEKRVDRYIYSYWSD